LIKELIMDIEKRYYEFELPEGSFEKDHLFIINESDNKDIVVTAHDLTEEEDLLKVISEVRSPKGWDWDLFWDKIKDTPMEVWYDLIWQIEHESEKTYKTCLGFLVKECCT
jgi:hypothetical protein